MELDWGPQYFTGTAVLTAMEELLKHFANCSGTYNMFVGRYQYPVNKHIAGFVAIDQQKLLTRIFYRCDFWLQEQPNKS